MSQRVSEARLYSIPSPHVVVEAAFLMMQASGQSSADAPRQKSPLMAFFLHPIARVGVILLAACCVLTVAAGDIGFQGDDWWVLSFPYWHAFPESVAAYARAALRPIEGLYWISLFEIFGFHRPPYLFASLALDALASSLFALCLLRLYPQQPRLAIWAALFSFFLAADFLARVCHAYGQLTARHGLFLGCGALRANRDSRLVKADCAGRSLVPVVGSYV